MWLCAIKCSRLQVPSPSIEGPELKKTAPAAQKLKNTAIRIITMVSTRDSKQPQVIAFCSDKHGYETSYFTMEMLRRNDFRCNVVAYVPQDYGGYVGATQQLRTEFMHLI